MEVAMNQEAVERFFAYARERHLIYLKRRAGVMSPWTLDPVMRQYRITNVFRELDKTTVWFRENVRDPMRDKPEVLLATVLFRWFNTIRTGETIFKQTCLPFDDASTGAQASAGGGETPWEAYLRTGSVEPIRDALRAQGAPWVTGAYMIRSPEGMDKLDGILHSFEEFSKGQHLIYPDRVQKTWRGVAELALLRREYEEDPGPVSLEDVWKWLKQFYGMGPFLAYEVVTDLRFTALLDRAPDIMTWANPGPGALRGANLILRGANRGRKGRLDKASYEETHEVQRQLLDLSRNPDYWPQVVHDEIQVSSKYVLSPVSEHPRLGDVSYSFLSPGMWPRWEMREPEMFLCEFAKLERTRLGFGRPRGTYP